MDVTHGKRLTEGKGKEKRHKKWPLQGDEGLKGKEDEGNRKKGVRDKGEGL